MVIPFQLSVVLLLIWSNQGLILPQGILTPAQKKRKTQGAGICFYWIHNSLRQRLCVSAPLSEVFKTEAQFVVMAKQLGVIRNVGEKDLRHLKGALLGGGTVTYLLRNFCFKH